MIDWARVAQLRKDIGEDDFDEVIDIFVDEVEGIIDRLREATSRDQLAAELHCLKGSAANLGFSAFAQICAAGEARMRGADGGDLDLGQVLQSYQASKASFLDGIASQLT